MRRSALNSSIAASTGLSADVVEQVLDGFAETILATVHAGDSVTWPGLFSIDVVHRPARSGRNPATGEPIQIPAANRARLRPGSQLTSAARRSSQ